MTTVNLKLSKDIFSKLMNGKVINKWELNEAGERSSNALFSEIMQNISCYENQYSMSGHELVSGKDYFFARSSEDEIMKLDITKKAVVLLLILGHYNSKKFSHDKLSNERGGISEEEIKEIEEDEIVEELLEKGEMSKNGLLHGIKTILVDRSIMWRKPNGKFILSDAGNAFYDDLVSSHHIKEEAESL